MNTESGKADLNAVEQRNPSKDDKRLMELVDDVRLLLRYAIESVQLPKSVDIEKIYEIRGKIETGGVIDEKDFKVLVRSYEALERRLGPVSASTLRATGKVDGGKSAAEIYVNKLWFRTMVNIGLILIFHLVAEYQKAPEWEVFRLIANYLIPFLYGALGADAYLLRETTQKLHLRQFDDRRIPENRARFLLGTLSGGMAVLFISNGALPVGGGEGGSLFVFETAAAAIGFLAGFSIDFLFGTIERVISAILPKVVQIHTHEDRRQQDELLHKYRSMMDSAEDKSVKKTLNAIVEDLELRARR